MQIHDIELPQCNIYTEEIHFLNPISDAGTLGEVNSQHTSQYLLITSALNQKSISPNFPVEVWTLTDPYELGGVRQLELLDETEGNYLRQCYNAMYPRMNQGSISSAVYKYSQFKIANELFGTQDSRSKRSSYILARWCGASGAQIDYSILRPARVISFFKHSTNIQNSLKPHLFARVEWFKPHASQDILHKFGAMIFLSHLVQPPLFHYRELNPSL